MRHQPRDDGYATRIARCQAARVVQHSPGPFEPDLLRDGRRPLLRARDEVERRSDAKHSGSFELVEATRGKDFLARRTERNKAKLRTGGADSVDREIRFTQ